MLAIYFYTHTRDAHTYYDTNVTIETGDEREGTHNNTSFNDENGSKIGRNGRELHVVETSQVFRLDSQKSPHRLGSLAWLHFVLSTTSHR